MKQLFWLCNFLYDQPALVKNEKRLQSSTNLRRKLYREQLIHTVIYCWQINCTCNNWIQLHL